MPHLTETLALMAVLGMSAQWLGWRFRIPVILLLILAGLAVGPLFGLIRPSQALEDAFQPLVSLAVAVILFEGGLTLRLSELRQAGRGIVRLISMTVLLGWLLGALAGHWVAGLSWPVSVVLGAIMIITGPTVILPLLRQSRLRRRPASFLKWEGISNDPAGAVLTLLAFQYYLPGVSLPVSVSLLHLLLGLAVAVLLGILAGRLLGKAFLAGWVPEYLKGPLAMAAGMAVYVPANLVLDEAGLVAATVAGLVLGNLDLPEIEEIRRFKSYISLMLVSALFLLLSADLDPEIMRHLDWRSLAYIGCLILLVRPLAVALATVGAGMSWQERLLVGWTGPRGVVAAAIAGVVGPALVARGFPGAELILPITFAMILSTVLLQGISLAWLGQRLGLGETRRGGLLIAGSNAWSIGLSQALHEANLSVRVADASWARLRPLRYAGVPIYFGDVLSEQAAGELELGELDSLLATSDNDAYNELVCTHYAHELGHQAVFQLPVNATSERERPVAAARGRIAFGASANYARLQRDWYRGHSFQITELTEQFTLADFLDDLDEASLLLAAVDPDGRIALFGADDEPAAAPGSKLVWFGCKRGCAGSLSDDPHPGGRRGGSG